MEPTAPEQQPEPRTSQTFSSGEGRTALGLAVASAVAWALERLELVEMDATSQHIILSGVFVLGAALILSRGVSKHGTGF